MFRNTNNTKIDEKVDAGAGAGIRADMEALSKSQAIIEFDPSGNILVANENFLLAMGYSLEDIRGKHHRIFVPEEQLRGPEYEAFWNTLRSGEFITTQCRRIANGGREIWLQASYCPVLDRQENVVKVIKFATDVTERKKHEADFEGQLRAISRAQAVIEFDLDGGVLTANDNFLNVMGYTLNEIVGQNHSRFMHPDEVRTPSYTEFWNKLRGGEYVSGRCRRITKSGGVVWLQASYNPILDFSGNPLKIVKYATDVTAEKQKEDDLQSLIDEMTEVMSSVASGDMTTSMTGVYKPELAVLVDSVNITIEQLGGVLGKVSGNTMLLTTASAELNDTFNTSKESAGITAKETQHVAEAVNQISVNVDDVVKALGQLTISIDEVSSNAIHAATVSESAVGLADNARTNMDQLADASNDISAVVKVISSIANQTNLLALNATIEAARAGEAGRGFAVVANEVKELAKETARATEDVTAKINAIQGGSQLAGKAIAEIVSTIGSINTTQVSIAKTVESQSQVSENIGRSVREVSSDSASIEKSIGIAASVAEENRVRAESSLSVTTRLLELSEELGALTSKMKFKKNVT